MSEETGPALGGAAPRETGVDLTRLTDEAAKKSGLLWLRIPGAGTHPVWHVWHDARGDGGGGDDDDDSDSDERSAGPAAYVVSGPDEQPLPWLPEEVEMILRSKDTGGRLLTLRATARRLEPATPAWDTAVEVLRPERLNATGDVAARWAAQNTIHVVTPHGPPLEAPGAYDDGSGAAPVRPGAPATVTRRPWHWRGRAGARRNTAR